MIVRVVPPPNREPSGGGLREPSGCYDALLLTKKTIRFTE